MNTPSHICPVENTSNSILEYKTVLFFGDMREESV